ncbi:MAG: BT4734/BF3469 family protein [Crocinitomicaceae bacterium]|nr:BT4734/BF3469 family protein [Crocinitomicaceae bacterium]
MKEAKLLFKSNLSIAWNKRTKLEKEFITLTERTPVIDELVKTFGLVAENGEKLPDITGLSNTRFSLFWQKGDNRRNVIPRKEITLTELVDIMDSKWLRDLSKVERPYITPYGIFSKRNNESIKHFNNEIVCLDFDKLTPKQMEGIKWDLEWSPSTIFVAISPSGNGIKALIRIKHGFTPENLYQGLKENIQLFEKHGATPDAMQFVLSQPMFLPYDENLYFNPYAIPLEGKLMQIKKEEPRETISSLKVVDMDRANNFFRGRVKYLLKSLEELPRGSGMHSYLYSVVKRIYPYINQQTIYTETQITAAIENILKRRYNSDKKKSELYRAIKDGRHPEESLQRLLNETEVQSH